jgi:hypothetical protein
VRQTLSYAEMKGWVRIELKPNPNAKTKKIRVYFAGPRLLQEIAR